MITTLFVMTLSSVALCSTPAQHRVEKVLDAIEKVESEGNPKMVGDQGRSRGAYQIQQPYWNEAMKRGHADWRYKERVWDKASSRQAVKWYWEKYAPEALRKGDQETLARIHNGGPAGATTKRSKTDVYWNKVKARMR